MTDTINEVKLKKDVLVEATRKGAIKALETRIAIQQKIVDRDSMEVVKKNEHGDVIYRGSSLKGEGRIALNQIKVLKELITDVQTMEL